MRRNSVTSVTWSLIASMAVVALSTTAASIAFLYHSAYEQTLNEMYESAATVAALMESVAEFDQRHSANTHPRGSWGATMSQIERGLGRRESSYRTEELIVGQLQGDQIVVSSRSAPQGTTRANTAPPDSAISESLSRTNRGEQGRTELLDDRGEAVLVGYAPVPTLGMGVVNKIDLAEVRAIYIRGALWVGLTALVLIGLGAFSFLRFIQPIRQRERENESRLGGFLQAADAALARLNEAQRLAKVGSWELDLTSNRLLWSDEIFRMFEIDPRRFAASYEAFLAAIHPEDRAAVNQAYTDSLTSRRPYEIVHRLQMPDGRIKYVREACESFFDAEGKPLRSVGTVQDISELHAVELELRQHRGHLEEMVAARTAALAERERELRQAQQIAQLGHWSVDLQTGALQWSDEIYRIFGRDRNDFAPSYDNFFACVFPDDRELVRNSEQQAARTGRHSVDHRVLRPDGSVRWVHEEAQHELDAAGKPWRLSGTVQDITERKQAEQALVQATHEAERANRAKSEFLSRMSHELRTPMNAILGFAQVLELEPLSATQRDFVLEVHRAADHLLDLINELLDLSRIEVGKLATVLQPVDVAAAAHDALQITGSIMQRRHITVLNHCRQRAIVLADPTRLKQILVNLLSNAATYNREGGRVTVGCATGAEGRLRISVQDSGAGIPPEKLAALFKPFERLGAEFTAVEGTGIGLALSKQLAELMGGRIGVDSTPGQGSTFWVEFPAAPAPDAESKRPALTVVPRAVAGKKVLYVEDNPANLRVVEALFRHQPQLQLLSATNGEYGLELARRYRPDAILLDIHLPGMDGYAVLDELKRHQDTKHIPVIALSADAMPIDIEKGLQAGFVHYLTKPVKGEELVGALRQAMAHATTPGPG